VPMPATKKSELICVVMGNLRLNRKKILAVTEKFKCEPELLVRQFQVEGATAQLL